ncbi:MAG: DUF4830 domain-containing protein [Oscillospiraceae bacterium]|nr:DUF4830 domain-containing protein [Oscillospiraceae bacterium]
MLIVTAKVPRRKLALWGLAAAALCCCALLINAGQLRGLEASAAISPKGIKTNEDRIAFLGEYGWQVNEQPLATEELIIPEAFDDSYDDYLSLQSAQGFDLSRYAGKRVKRYTYEITNYPTGEKGVQANLLIYKNTVVAGEVLSAQLDGFLHGLAAPS